jgi:hypothetical protein
VEVPVIFLKNIVTNVMMRDGRTPDIENKTN